MSKYFLKNRGKNIVTILYNKMLDFFDFFSRPKSLNNDFYKINNRLRRKLNHSCSVSRLSTYHSALGYIVCRCTRLGTTLTTKLNELSNKNEGLKILQKISSVLLGEIVQLEDLYQDPTILSCFKYAPITSVDVELPISVHNTNK
ncbi:piwi-like protein Siwi [Aphis craccivora]|uniref:Piwi-like protein Siwi n=1 Tax=Aphis craccivora TaxID=307492 RepID=A0A6G0YSW2_APHCR|nr:piwi-like protein Siwi [Aphis craccivora]